MNRDSRFDNLLFPEARHFSIIVVAGSVSRRAIPHGAISGIAAPLSTNTRCVLFGRPGRLLHISDLPTTKYDNGDTEYGCV